MTARRAAPGGHRGRRVFHRRGHDLRRMARTRRNRHGVRRIRRAVARLDRASRPDARVSIGMGRGKLWAVRLFRWPSYGAIVCYLPILAAGVLLDAGSTPIDSGLAWAILGFAVVKLPCLFIIYRALKQVRWLDPASLPHEWEPSARRGA
ncbi:hypothetical protein BMA10247_A1055 [Burkholderia mallei NCTC 10247]|nr:hypothetical protein [Burkholderia mallei]ABM49453.1 hypothetical protein BMASAVP1_0242 [Burkholderia mallei SAVP1]ABO02672.1 hypothetical protein BMA10247_A1055 [Burkholderia mallei NCTC 10247]